MSKKIVISLTLGIIIVLIVFFVFRQKQTGDTAPIGNDETSFGQPSTVIDPTFRVEDSSSSTYNDQTASSSKSKLVKISNAMTSGGIVLKQGSSTIVRFVERSTGNVYDFTIDLKSLRRISNTTIPAIAESFWNVFGTNVLLRYQSDEGNIITYSGAIVAKTASTTSQSDLKGSLLPTNIGSIVFSPSGTRIFYTETINGITAGYVSNTDGIKPQKIFDSPFSEITAYWPKEDTIIVATKPSTEVIGYIYSVDVKTKNIKNLMSGKGITVLPSPDMTQIAYGDGAGRLYIYNTKDASTIKLGLNTIPEKCVWSKKQKNTLYCAGPLNVPVANYPDDWYQGVISFTDTLYKIDTTQDIPYIVSNLKETYNQRIDAVDLSLSQNEDYLLFTNKKDYTLWTFNINY